MSACGFLPRCCKGGTETDYDWHFDTTTRWYDECGHVACGRNAKKVNADGLTVCDCVWLCDMWHVARACIGKYNLSRKWLSQRRCSHVFGQNRVPHRHGIVHTSRGLCDSYQWSITCTQYHYVKSIDWHVLEMTDTCRRPLLRCCPVLLSSTSFVPAHSSLLDTFSLLSLDDNVYSDGPNAFQTRTVSKVLHAIIDFLHKHHIFSLSLNTHGTIPSRPDRD